MLPKSRYKAISYLDRADALRLAHNTVEISLTELQRLDGIGPNAL